MFASEGIQFRFFHSPQTLKHSDFLRSSISGVIISDGLSEQKNMSDIKTRKHTPLRHHSCSTQHLGLNLLPFNSFHHSTSKKLHTHWFHHAVSKASKTAWFMKSRRTVLTGSIYKSLSANNSLLERDFQKRKKTKSVSENTTPTPRI